MSRQRLRPSIYEAEFVTCEQCLGVGRIRSLESLTLKALHKIEKEATNYNEKSLTIKIPEETALHILNNKRKELFNIEEKRNITINIVPDPNLKDEENILKNINTLNENSNKQNSKSETDNKKSNKIKRPSNKNKFKKFNSKAIDKNNKHNSNIGNKNTTKENIVNKKITNEKEVENKNISNEKKIHKNISKTPNTKPIKKAKQSKAKEYPKNSMQNKEELVKISKTKKVNKATKPKKKGPAKKGWWNKEEN
jgi:ribonuclease E